jgi:hypothetical protein
MHIDLSNIDIAGLPATSFAKWMASASCPRAQNWPAQFYYIIRIMVTANHPRARSVETDPLFEDSRNELYNIADDIGEQTI